MTQAKVFKSGNSQAVRLPKEYRLDTDTVTINRIGNIIVLLPKGDPWGAFSEGIRELGEDFPKSIRKLKNRPRAHLK